jgi:hypothetical protein
VDDSYQTSVVHLLGYPGVGKRTVRLHLAEMLDGVLVDNQLINVPILTLFKWGCISGVCCNGHCCAGGMCCLRGEFCASAGDCV